MEYLCNSKQLTDGYGLSIEKIAMQMKAKKQGRWFSLMANGNIINKILIWKMIKKKFLKKLKTSAKKYLQKKRESNMWLSAKPILGFNFTLHK